MDATRCGSLAFRVYGELLCVICHGLPVDAVVTDPCGHALCYECVNLWRERGNTTCPECMHRAKPLLEVLPVPGVQSLIAALREKVPEISQLETVDIANCAMRAIPKPQQSEEAAKTIDMELDPDGLDPKMTLLSHKYFRLLDSTPAKVVLRTVKSLLGTAEKPSHLFVTAGKPQKILLHKDMTMRDVKWLFEQSEVKKMTLYYTSRP